MQDLPRQGSVAYPPGGDGVDGNGDDGGGGGGDYFDLDYLYQVYLPSSLLVLATWGSFLVPPEMLPARLILLVSSVCSSSSSNLSSKSSLKL